MKKNRINCMLLIVLLSFPGLFAVAVNAQNMFDYNSTRVSAINLNGQNLLTGNGIYLIGSASGVDNPDTNFSSVGSNGSTMTNGGPPFKLRFWKKNSNTLGFQAEVGPANRNINQLLVALDFERLLINKLAFNAAQYRFECTGQDGRRTGSSLNYQSIPRGCAIKNDAGTILGYVGAVVTDPVSWGEISGSSAKIRVNILSSTRYRRMSFFNHFLTNGMGIEFGSLRTSEKASVEGEIIVSATNSGQSLTFDAESDLQHQIGFPSNNGWSVNVLNTPKRYMCYGPYTNAVAQGNRTADFRLLIDNVTSTNDLILTIDVYNALNGSVLARKDIRRRDFSQANVYQDFSLPFSAPLGGQLEFRTYWHGRAAVTEDRVVIR